MLLIVNAPASNRNCMMPPNGLDQDRDPNLRYYEGTFHPSRRALLTLKPEMKSHPLSLSEALRPFTFCGPRLVSGWGQIATRILIGAPSFLSGSGVVRRPPLAALVPPGMSASAS